MSKGIACVGIACLSLLLVVGCAAPESPSADGGESEGAEKKSTSEPRLAPEFTLARIGSGDEFSLSDSDGRIRIVDFWTTWCPPCREEIPMLNELQEAYGDRGFDVIAISPEEPDVLAEFQADHPVVYTSLVGNEELVHEYGAVGYPTAFLIDAEGYVVEVFFGPKPRSVLEAKIEELLSAS